ncbi:MAG: phospholipase [Proteobacteria bacterium]|nr:phospholipase [Pseudomonadota bacterium]
MTTLDRRAFLRRTAAVAAGLATPSLATATTRTPAAPRGARLSDVDHIIVLMKENRSFDHYFGTFAGVRGFDDAQRTRDAAGRTVLHQPDPQNPDGYVLPFHLDTARTSAQALADLNHSWGPQHGCWNRGAMDRFVTLHRQVDGANGPLTMGYYEQADIPYYHALADAFTLCDGYFCSQFGPTHPNRLFLMTGSIDADGVFGRPQLDNSGRGLAWETYPERLTRAGVSWRVYHDVDDFGCNVLRYFTQYANSGPTSELRENALRVRPLATLLADIATGNLPQVTWIVPPAAVSEHPDFLPAAGEDHTARIVAALWANPALWAHTVLVIDYDENDGQFDHVAPPVPPPGTPGEYVHGLPVGLGFRVPCLVVSPFSRGGYVVSDTYDHTSTLRLIEARFGVEVPYLSRWRRETCGDLTATLGLGDAPDLSLPAMPATGPRLAAVQASVGGLPPPTVPATQRVPVQQAGPRKRRGRTPAT